MPYVGNQPSGNFVQVTSQTITGNGGATYTLDRPAGNSAELEVFVNHVRQDPASYTVSGTSLQLGGNITSSDSCYVVFQSAGVGTVSHPATNNLQAADGTFSGAVSGATGTFTGNVGINTSAFENTNGTEFNIKGGTNNTKPAVITMQGASGDGAGFVQTEVFGIASVSSATEITRITGTGANGMRMLIHVTVTGHTGSLDNGHNIGRYYWNGGTNSVVTIEQDVNANGNSPSVTFDTSTSNVCIVKLASGNASGSFNGVMEIKWYVPIDFAGSTWTVS